MTPGMAANWDKIIGWVLDSCFSNIFKIIIIRLFTVICRRCQYSHWGLFRMIPSSSATNCKSALRLKQPPIRQDCWLMGCLAVLVYFLATLLKFFGPHYQYFKQLTSIITILTRGMFLLILIVLVKLKLMKSEWFVWFEINLTLINLP